MARDEDSAQSRRPARRPRIAMDAQAEAILASAERLFLTHGFAGTSIEMLIAETGGSKRDIYRLFGNKRTLFQKVVTHLSEQGALAIQMVSACPLEEGLSSIARSFLGFLLSERALNLHRLMVADAARLGETGREFLRQGPGASYRKTADYLRVYFGQAGLTNADAEQAARIFIDSFSADLQLRALLGDVASSSELDDRINAAVQIFAVGMRQRFQKI